MISRFSSQLALRLKQDAVCTQYLSHNLRTIRHVSTEEFKPADSHPATPELQQRRPRPSVRTETAVEKAYKRRKASGKKIRPMQVDAYTQRLLETRKAAIQARTIDLRAARPAEVDDPIHGKGETPFVKSLEIAMPDEDVFIPTTDGVPSRAPNPINTGLKDHAEILNSENTGVAKPTHLSHFLTTEQLERFGKFSNAMTAPVTSPTRVNIDPQAELEKKQQHEEDHATRMAALARILAVENADAKQKSRVNTRRIIDEFGRHNTDKTIDPRQNIRQPYHEDDWTPKQRIGPDTGSSEVQIGLLTMKIQRLAAEFEGVSKNDKANKRNLRLLLHRRQKLLKYFYKRDKGGERWQNMVEKLGITPAMWKGQIELR